VPRAKHRHGVPAAPACERPPHQRLASEPPHAYVTSQTGWTRAVTPCACIPGFGSGIRRFQLLHVRLPSLRTAGETLALHDLYSGRGCETSLTHISHVSHMHVSLAPTANSFGARCQGVTSYAHQPPARLPASGCARARNSVLRQEALHCTGGCRVSKVKGAGFRCPRMTPLAPPRRTLDTFLSHVQG